MKYSDQEFSGFNRVWLSLLAFATGMWAATSMAALPTYHVKELPFVQNGAITAAYGINNSGSVVGYTQLTGDTAYPAIWAAQTYELQTLQLPAGAKQIKGYGAWAAAINDANQIAGRFTPRNNRPTTAVWDTPITSRVLFPPSRLWQYNAPLAINNAGVTVGITGISTNNYRPTIWASDGTASYLALVPGGPSNGTANGINDAGTVVGTATVPGDNNISYAHAYLWNAAGEISDLGIPAGFIATSGIDLNRQDQVVGTLVTAASSTHPSAVSQGFLWTRETGFTPIPQLPNAVTTTPSKVNNFGFTVGFYTAVDGTARSFIWAPQHETTDLVSLIDPADPLRDALDRGFHASCINDSGYIVGYYLLSNGATRAVVLIPDSPPS